MTLTPNTRLVVVDTETFGLDTRHDMPLEVAFALYNLDLEPVAKFSTTIWSFAHANRYSAMVEDVRQDPEDSEAFVLNMHEKNNLFTEAARGNVTMAKAVAAILAWLDKHEIGRDDPLVGSTVGFDRAVLREWMPVVEARFSHRSIDVSSVKELARRYAPEFFSHGQEVFKAGAAAKHRAADDIVDTMHELEYYVLNGFITPSS